jgi:histidyl-tRNA synthetase
VRGVGEATDIVGKEMYTFADKNGKSLTLRPGEHGAGRPRLRRARPARVAAAGATLLHRAAVPLRAAAARAIPQFHQIGAELLGDPGPWSDAEIVLLLMSFPRASSAFRT